MARRVLAVVAIAALVVVLVEGVLRTLGDRLDPPLEWYHEAAQEAVESMDRLRAAGLTADAVFVGTSMIRADVQVPTIEQELDSVDRAASVALPAAQIPVVRHWLLEVVMPRLEPRRVVWGVQSLDFNGARAVPTIERYEEGRAVRPGVLGALDRGLASLFATSRYRVQLRDPHFVVDLLHERPATAELPLDDLLSPANNRTTDNKTAGELRRIRNQVLNDFEVGTTEAADFRRTIADLQADGVEVVIVLMPVPPRYIDAHPLGRADFDAFRAWVTAEADQLGVQILDYSESMPGGSFVDYTHLGPEGALDFTLQLAADLRGLGW